MVLTPEEHTLDRILSADPVLATLSELFPEPPDPALVKERCGSA